MATENAEDSFSKQVSDSLGHYVYRIIDPRNGKTFYVGKGQRCRVFKHAKGANAASEAVIRELQEELLNELTTEQSKDPQVETKVRKEIRETTRILNSIRKAGLKPVYIIHRHGMTERTAFEVEAALIDAYRECDDHREQDITQLTNVQGGHYSKQRGRASIAKVNYEYDPKEMDDPTKKYKVLTLNVNYTAPDPENPRYEDALYDAVRLAWGVSVPRAEQADLIFAMVHGVCRGVYKDAKWKPATIKNFPSLLEKDKRGLWGFDAVPAEAYIQNLYKDKRLPECLKRKWGNAHSFRYLRDW